MWFCYSKMSNNSSEESIVLWVIYFIIKSSIIFSLYGADVYIKIINLCLSDINTWRSLMKDSVLLCVITWRMIKPFLGMPKSSTGERLFSWLHNSKNFSKEETWVEN